MQTLSSVCEQNVASVRNLEIELQTLVYQRNQQDLLIAQLREQILRRGGV